MSAPEASSAAPTADPRAMRLGVISADPALAEAVSAIPGLAVGATAAPDGGWAQVINPNIVDAVVIDAPPAARGAMLQDAVAVGVPVLCRGALCDSAADMTSLKRLVGLSGGLVMAWHPWLFDSGWGALRELGEMLGPVRAVRATTAFAEPMETVDLIWRGAEDVVAACLELLGKTPTHCAAEPMDGGVLLRLAFPGDVAVQVALRQGVGAAAAEESFTIYRASVVMAWSRAAGLSLHPPVDDFAPLPAEGESIDLPEMNGDSMALQTFAHMVVEAEPQPQMLDFAADVIAALDGCVKSLNG